MIHSSPSSSISVTSNGNGGGGDGDKGNLADWQRQRRVDGTGMCECNSKNRLSLINLKNYLLVQSIMPEKAFQFMRLKHFIGKKMKVSLSFVYLNPSTLTKIE